MNRCSFARQEAERALPSPEPIGRAGRAGRREARQEDVERRTRNKSLRCGSGARTANGCVTDGWELWKGSGGSVRARGMTPWTDRNLRGRDAGPSVEHHNMHPARLAGGDGRRAAIAARQPPASGTATGTCEPSTNDSYSVPQAEPSLVQMMPVWLPFKRERLGGHLGMMQAGERARSGYRASCTQIAIWVRFSASSFCRTRAVCVFTVERLMKNFAAISAFESPSATASAISRSRSES